ncbi:hypothetical protein COO60DRAFT_1627872 [Scenedesmus sp. NREL 46B-D3]|nr:hypothetical protein COO60DRAFT_1627872 [Scenedesmus sp. NREL 46B-D3]
MPSDMYSTAASNGANKPRKERKLTVIFKHTTADQHVGGVEALAVSPDSSSLYTASRDSIVKRWNVGAGSPQCSGSFEGHIDWVNDVLLYQDKLVSCSSDRTVKIWQAGEEARCLHTVQHHSDYVTCLAASESAGKLVSAGLRSEVITYDMQAPMRSAYALAMSRAGTLVAAGTTESYIRLLDPRTGQKVMKLKGHTDNVRALLLNKEGTLLLSGSSDNTVRLWDLGQQRCVQRRQGPGSVRNAPAEAQSLAAGEGEPPHTQHRLAALRVLTDKRHVLTKDANGHVQLWDVLAGQPIQQLGQVDIADMERRLFRPLYVESWFTADIKLGALALNLEPPKCFAAECYASLCIHCACLATVDLGVRDVPDDQKVNLGSCLLRTALSQWAHEFSRLHMSGAPLPGLDDPGADQLPHFSDQLPPAVVSASASGVAWRLNANAFTGHEREGEDVPPWVCEAVLRGQLPFVKELKSAFVLLPAEGSGLPSLLQSRLNAPRILQVMKLHLPQVANYCVTKLAELNVPLSTHEVGLSPDTQQPPANGKQFLELTCNGLNRELGRSAAMKVHSALQKLLDGCCCRVSADSYALKDINPYKGLYKKYCSKKRDKHLVAAAAASDVGLARAAHLHQSFGRETYLLGCRRLLASADHGNAMLLSMFTSQVSMVARGDDLRSRRLLDLSTRMMACVGILAFNPVQLSTCLWLVGATEALFAVHYAVLAWRIDAMIHALPDDDDYDPIVVKRKLVHHLKRVDDVQGSMKHWFVNAQHWDDIKRGNFKELFAYAVWYKSMDQMAADGLEDELEDLVCQLERHAGCKLPEGYNSELRFMCHLWDPLRHIYRPLVFYVVMELLAGLCHVVLAAAGFQLQQLGGISYYTLHLGPQQLVQLKHVSMRLVRWLPTVDDMADGTAAIMAAHGVDRAVVMAHSYGTMVAARLVLKYEARVHSLCLMDPDYAPNVASVWGAWHVVPQQYASVSGVAACCAITCCASGQSDASRYYRQRPSCVGCEAAAQACGVILIKLPLPAIEHSPPAIEHSSNTGGGACIASLLYKTHPHPVSKASLARIV